MTTMEREEESEEGIVVVVSAVSIEAYEVAITFLGSLSWKVNLFLIISSCYYYLFYQIASKKLVEYQRFSGRVWKRFSSAIRFPFS